MQCERVLEALPAYLEEDMPDGQRLAVEAHLEGCPGCSRDRELLVRSWAMLENWEPVEPSYQLKAQVWEKIRLAPPPTLWERILSLAASKHGPSRGLAMGLCTMCLMFGAFQHLNTPVSRELPAVAAIQASAPEPAASQLEEESSDVAQVGEFEGFPDVALEPEKEEEALPPVSVGHLSSHHWLDGVHGALGEILEDKE